MIEMNRQSYACDSKVSNLTSESRITETAAEFEVTLPYVVDSRARSKDRPTLTQKSYYIESNTSKDLAKVSTYINEN